MKYLFNLLFLLLCLFGSAQDKPKPKKSLRINNDSLNALKPKIDKFKIISLQKDTIIVDTTISIKKEYEYNYLRKDIFGFLPFSNEGQTYTTLNYSLKKINPLPEFGYLAKHFNYQEVDDVKYYSVATPFSELYFKTVMEQGQSLETLITLNTSKRLNISVAYKGLRSLGKYVNQLTSSGNFKFTLSYNTKNEKYFANFHFTGQDLSNGENGGITTLSDFERQDNTFKNRARLLVFLRDANTFLKGKRFFLDHSFSINKKGATNNLAITHQFNYETKYFEYSQLTLTSKLTSDLNEVPFSRFGDSYLNANSNIKDINYYNKLYNKIGLVYENSTLGKFEFFIDDFRFNNYYEKVFVVNNEIIPNRLSSEINSIGGQYEYRKNKWNGVFIYSNSISKSPTRNLDASLNYKIDTKNIITFQYQNISKLPNNNFELHQSSFVQYNWYNSFKNEKINNIIVNAQTQYLNATLQISSLLDHLYFKDNQQVNKQQLVTPFQYNNAINYISLKINKEFKYKKFALDNTFLYQKVDQSDAILNLPQLTFRNTLYYSNKFFKKNLSIQTGLILNYFTNYYADDYNPIISEFFVQTNKKIGNFPLFDFFINAKIRQTKIFLKAEHFNSGFTGNNYYSAPNTPYQDFIIRFGLVWNFFQ